MAIKTKPISQVKQLFLLQQQGHKIKVLARNWGISKNTVKSLLEQIIRLNKPIGDLLSLDDLALVSIFNPSYLAFKYERY